MSAARHHAPRDGRGRFRSFLRAKLLETTAALETEVYRGRRKVKRHSRRQKTGPPADAPLLEATPPLNDTPH